MQYKSSFFFIYFENFGVLLVWGGFLYTPIDSQKHKVFFILPRHFRGKLLPWYSDRLSLVPATTALTRAPYDLFGKPLFSHFHTEPLTGKSFKKHMSYFRKLIYISCNFQNARFFLFFFNFLVFLLQNVNLWTKSLRLCQRIRGNYQW